MQAVIVTDLGYGDCGKGTTVDFLARQSANPVIVRFNGGAQAAHNVCTEDGRHHTFSQFGSGMFVETAQTFLSRFVLFDPIACRREATQLSACGVRSPLKRLYVDGDAPVVTPFAIAANRLREIARGNGRHGSVGMGVGETVADILAQPDLAIRVRDLRNRDVLIAQLRRLQQYKRDALRDVIHEVRSVPGAVEYIDIIDRPESAGEMGYMLHDAALPFRIVSMSTLQRLAQTHPLVFEGAQGVLLDEWHGFHPFTTWSTTTCANANTLLDDIEYHGCVTRYGVVRSYSTRHGPGPFPSEDVMLTRAIPDSHNRFSEWQREFRIGWFDVPLTRYALSVAGGVDQLVVTHLDRLQRQLVSAYSIDSMTLTDREQASIRCDPESGHMYSVRQKDDLEDLSYQEMLTSLLSRVKPVLTKSATNPDGFVEHIEDLTGLPVGITSRGRTAAEKNFRILLSATA